MGYHSDALRAAVRERVSEVCALGIEKGGACHGTRACLNRLPEGDVLDLDRSGVEAFHLPMEATAPEGRAFFEVRAAFAKMERNVIRQR